MRVRHPGFTLIELLVVLAIVAILALMAVPSFQGHLIRQQITAALPLAGIAESPVAAAWAATQTFPEDNAAAGLPPPDKIVNYTISSVSVEDGAIQITFGNRAYGQIKGKVLSLRPAVVEGYPVVPVTWVCGDAAPPKEMTAEGENRTNVPLRYLPFKCR